MKINFFIVRIITLHTKEINMIIMSTFCWNFKENFALVLNLIAKKRRTSEKYRQKRNHRKICHRGQTV